MIKNIYMPDIGNYENITITNILISKYKKIKKNDNIVTVESGKTSIDIKSPYNGIINEIKISIGNNIKKGYILLNINTNEKKKKLKDINDKKTTKIEDKIQIHDKIIIYASPNIRRLARELKIKLNEINGSGKNNRIIKKNLTNIKTCSNNFGPTEITNLTQKKILSNNILHNSWTKIPHVTQFSKIDITNLLNIYIIKKNELKKKNISLTLLPFIIKSITKSLINYPNFNASLNDNNNIIIKKYYNIGIITATNSGLITPIIKNVNKKSIFELNEELILIRKKINTNNLLPNELEGGSFSISSLGNHTSGFFTPIIKYPESSIIGISKYQTKQIIQQNKKIISKTFLPLSLSYDHRLIDGLEAINFINYFNKHLNNTTCIENE